jgi:hypothetical protein
VVVSDLHLGSRSEGDVLRRRVARDALLERLDGADRLVLLGDAIELRQSPARDAMAIAQPVLEELGAALGTARRSSWCPAITTHALVAPWLERRGAHVEPPPLGLEEHPGKGASAATEAIAQWIAPAQLTVAYPRHLAARRRLRDARPLPRPSHDGADVRAPRRRDHGAPRRRGPGGGRQADDYEAALAPLYAWMHAMAERSGGGKRRPAVERERRGVARARRRRAPAAARPPAGRNPSARDLGREPPRARAGTADFSAEELRRAGVLAMAEAVDRSTSTRATSSTATRTVPGPRQRRLDGVVAWRWRAGSPTPAAGSTRRCSCSAGARARTGPGSVVEVRDSGPPILSRC